MASDIFVVITNNIYDWPTIQLNIQIYFWICFQNIHLHVITVFFQLPLVCLDCQYLKQRGTGRQTFTVYYSEWWNYRMINLQSDAASHKQSRAWFSANTLTMIQSLSNINIEKDDKRPQYCWVSWSWLAQCTSSATGFQKKNTSALRSSLSTRAKKTNRRSQR